MGNIFTKENIKHHIHNKITEEFGIDVKNASDEIFYRACALVVRDILAKKRKTQVYYLCMEFLMGRSLRNNIYNLELQDAFGGALKDFGVNIDNLYELEPDAGLGNGGLGRLAACYLDGMATDGYTGMGYSICYQFGIFKQKFVDGWQTETPDNWLPGGQVWLVPREDAAHEVKFGGVVDEMWEDNYHHVQHRDYHTVRAIPYDMYVSGYKTESVSLLRLWKASSPFFDMEAFNRGDYVNAGGQSSADEAISKVLYPNDNNVEGKTLRLKQQYFLVSASINDIITHHMETYGTVENLPEKVAIHINDTHPSLAIPELMRILLDDCGYSWDRSWEIVTQTFAYTNHTVMREALETWNEDLFRGLLPRIYQIIHEINERYCKDLFENQHVSLNQISRMAVLANHEVRMANLSVIGSHSVNGVSKLHSEIIKEDVFHDFYTVTPQKFTNVTNGIATRRWLYQANPALTDFIRELIGDRFIKDASELSKLNKYLDDKAVLEQLAKVKKINKENFAKHILDKTGVSINTDSIFDSQVKRLHEYKRQHLNALNIIAQYQYLKENPNADFVPKTYIFGAKAAPGYFLAKRIIKLLFNLAGEIEKDPIIREKLRIVYLEDYSVTLSELLMPASEISEQISLAGTEASGTGNMKMMINGAVTIGTLDGANVEIKDAVGDDNIIIFGMTTEEVNERKRRGYFANDIYQNNPVIKHAVDLMYSGIGDCAFGDVADSIAKYDPYMVLADFNAYQNAQAYASSIYPDIQKWQRMSLANIAGAGIFSADRAVRDYAENIWHMD